MHTRTIGAQTLTIEVTQHWIAGVTQAITGAQGAAGAVQGLQLATGVGQGVGLVQLGWQAEGAHAGAALQFEAMLLSLTLQEDLQLDWQPDER